MLPFVQRSDLTTARRSASALTGDAYWTRGPEELYRELRSGAQGLPSLEAAERLRICGPNEVRSQGRLSRVRVFARQLRSPLLLILVVAAALAAATGEWADSLIVLVIVAVSSGLAYVREYAAEAAADALRRRMRTRTTVLRDQRPIDQAVSEMVPGDVVLLSAGSLVPADAIVLEATDCFVSEAVLTGESFPVESRRVRAPPMHRCASAPIASFSGRTSQRHRSLSRGREPGRTPSSARSPTG